MTEQGEGTSKSEQMNGIRKSIIAISPEIDFMKISSRSSSRGALPPIAAADKAEAAAKKIVRLCDTNHDGKLTVTEIVRALVQYPETLADIGLHEDMPEDVILEKFLAMDADGNGKLDAEEFIQGAKELCENKGNVKIKRSIKYKEVSQQEAGESDADKIPAEFQDHIAIDCKRRALLQTARKRDPIELFFDFHMIFDTVIPSAIFNKVTILVFLIYAVVATFTRLQYWIVVESRQDYCTAIGTCKTLTSYFKIVEANPESLSGFSLLTPFLICFYIGYCYNRFYAQYFASMRCESRIVDICTMARAYIKPKESLRDTDLKKYESGKLIAESLVHDLWRYVNIVHIAGYCGLSPVYNNENLFTPFLNLYGLVDEEDEMLKITRLNVDMGGRVYNEVMNWTFQVVGEAYEAGLIELMREKSIQAKLIEFREAIKSLYDYDFQVMPFVYTHLVSLTMTVFLICESIKKGVLFTPIIKDDDGTILSPGADYWFGLIFPALSLITTAIVCVGLVEIGSRLSNPYGTDCEDLAVFHFINYSAATSRQVIDSLGRHAVEEHMRNRSMAEKRFKQLMLVARLQVHDRDIPEKAAKLLSRQATSTRHWKRALKGVVQHQMQGTEHELHLNNENSAKPSMSWQKPYSSSATQSSDADSITSFGSRQSVSKQKPRSNSPSQNGDADSISSFGSKESLHRGM